MTKEELTNTFKYIVKKCDMLINNGDYEADTYTQDTVEDIAELCNHILDGDYGKLVEVKGVDLEKELKYYCSNYYNCDYPKQLEEGTCSKVMPHIVSAAKHFFELGLKARKGEIWKVVDNVNHPQADRNKIYCVFTKQQYILATVINHPQDEDLLQWKCTEFPFHRYDMCEGDKYMQIV